MRHGADCPNCGTTNYGGGYCNAYCEREHEIYTQNRRDERNQKTKLGQALIKGLTELSETESQAKVGQIRTWDMATSVRFAKDNMIERVEHEGYIQVVNIEDYRKLESALKTTEERYRKQVDQMMQDYRNLEAQAEMLANALHDIKNQVMSMHLDKQSLTNEQYKIAREALDKYTKFNSKAIGDISNKFQNATPCELLQNSMVNELVEIAQLNYEADNGCTSEYHYRLGQALKPFKLETKNGK